MIGPYLGGALLDAHLPLAADYALFAVAGLLSATAVLMVHRLSLNTAESDRTPLIVSERIV
jgi:hypothetical protein